MNKIPLKDGRTIRRYSNSFKQKVLEELASGRMTKQEAIRYFEIAPGTFYHWMEKFSRLD